MNEIIERPLQTEPKQLNRMEIGKLRKQFITRELPTVSLCGHKIDPDEMPHNKCDSCWFSFFNQDGEKVNTWHEEYKTNQKDFVSKYGLLFMKQYRRFMSTVVNMAKEQGQNKLGE